MTKCKKRSMMLPEIERVRGEQLRGTPEARRLAWSDIQCPSHRIQLFLDEATQFAPLGQVLPQQTVGVLVDAALPGTVRDSSSPTKATFTHKSYGMNLLTSLEEQLSPILLKLVTVK